MFKNKFIIIILGVLFIFIAIPRIIFPDLDHGDEFLDADSANAVKNFVKFGFIKCRFESIFEPQIDTPINAYTHGPPLLNVFPGMLSMLFKTDSLFFLRSIGLLFSLLNIIFFYLFIKNYACSYLLGIIAVIFYFINPFFIFSMDSFAMPPGDFLRSVIIFLFYKMALTSSRKRQTGEIFLWLVIFVESLLTFDSTLYVFLFFIFFKVFWLSKKVFFRKKVIIMLFSISIFSLLVRFLKNSWYFGSFILAFRDTRDILIKRTFGGYELPQGLNFLAWFKYVILRNFSLVFYFDAFIILLSVFFAYLLYLKLSNEAQEKIKKLFHLFVIFIICGISWYVFFPSHSLAHAFVNFLPRNLVPAAAIGFTIFVYIIYSFLKENNLWSNIYLRTSWMAIVCVIILTGIFKSELPITPDKIKRAQDFKVFTRCLFKLREISSEKDDIGVNYFRFPFIRYYTHRHCSAVFDKDLLEKLPALPNYFIFIPYNDQKSQELFKFLQEKYTLLWQCDSLRFPAIFFKLKNT